MKIEVETNEAPRILDWIANRGGVAVWKTLDLSNAGHQTYTPARTATGEPTTRPGWQFASQPDAIITDPADVVIYTERLFKAFAVSLRQKGMTLVLSDAAQHRLNKVMNDCRKKHGNAHYRKGVLPEKAASIGVYWSEDAPCSK